MAEPFSPDDPAEPQARRDRVVWLAPLAILIAVVAVVGWRWTRAEEFAWLGVPQEQIRVPPQLVAVDRVAADPGAFAGANLLLITLDTTRAGRLGYYGNTAIATPALDRLAAEGVLFSNAISPTPTTLPTHTSILTGLYPVHHGVRANGRFRLADERQTLAESLQARGYATGAVVSAFVLDSRFGLSQGFEHYDDEINVDGFNQELDASERRAEVTTERALDWLRGRQTDPFFLWVHYFDPHANYDPPEPFRGRYPRNAYDGEIAYMDREIGRLLDQLDASGAAERTLVVVAGDHGESLAEHSEHTHGYLIYDVTLRVPLILRCGRRLGGGNHIARRVSLVDIAPTIHALLGISAVAQMDGIDLCQPPAGSRQVFAETYHGWMEYGWAALLAVYSGNYKLIHGPQPELFDLAADPNERRNLHAREPQIAQRLTEELRAHYGSEVGGEAELHSAQTLSQDELARLQALGYAFGGADEHATGAARRDPKSRIELVNSIFEIRCYYAPQGLHAKSVALLNRLSDDYPDSYSLLYNLGMAHWNNGQPDEAAAALQECIELRPTAPEARHRLAQLRMAEHEYEEAVALLKTLVEQHPADLGTQCDLAAALASMNRFREAAAHARIAFELDPTDADALKALSTMLPRIGAADELQRRLRAALVSDARRFAIRRELAAQLLKTSRFREAETLLRAGVDVDRTAAAPRARLGLLLANCPDPAIHDAEEAAQLLASLGELADVQDTLVLFDAARGWDALGQAKRALEIATRARDLANRRQQAEMRAKLDALILQARANQK